MMIIVGLILFVLGFVCGSVSFTMWKRQEIRAVQEAKTNFEKAVDNLKAETKRRYDAEVYAKFAIDGMPRKSGLIGLN